MAYSGTVAVNGATSSFHEDSASDRDSSDSVSSMSSDEIETHFVERDNRRFQSPATTRSCLYPLPVDDLEGQRLDRAHELIKEVIGGLNYRGPVPETLTAPARGRTVRVLDVCTGNGKWVDEMAAEFPHAKIYGLDIVPLATRYPADNVQYEIHDINTPMRWTNGQFNIVHMRQLCLSPIAYPAVLREAARLLRPGGLFLAGEWMLGICDADGSPVRIGSNGVSNFLLHLSDITRQMHLFYNPSEIPEMLLSSPFYESVVSERHLVPLDNTPRGDFAKRLLHDFGDAVQFIFRNAGLPSSRIEGILQALHRDLGNSVAFCLTFLTVHARRRAI